MFSQTVPKDPPQPIFVFPRTNPLSLARSPGQSVRKAPLLLLPTCSQTSLGVGRWPRGETHKQKKFDLSPKGGNGGGEETKIGRGRGSPRPGQLRRRKKRGGGGREEGAERRKVKEETKSGEENVGGKGIVE